MYLRDNRFLYFIGMYDFHKFSLNHLEVQTDTEVILLVITRWDSQDKRQSIRHMITNSQGWSAVHFVNN
jgi:hypothetical protein